MFDPFDNKVGGFSENDGTIDFYLRIRHLLSPDVDVLDIGAGRGAWFKDADTCTKRLIRHITPDVRSLTAIDIDMAVLENQSSTVNLHYDDSVFPMEDNSIDVAIADYVLEHVDQPAVFVKEIHRVLKPGGYFCARTPHRWHYVALASRSLSLIKQAYVLSKFQPNRQSQDIFPTYYRLNSEKVLRRFFYEWTDYTFLFRCDPSYFMNSRSSYIVASTLHRWAPLPLVANIFVFVQKPTDA